MSKCSSIAKGTYTRRRVLDYLQTHPEGATLGQLKVPAGVSSSSTIHGHVQKLAAAGLVIHSPNKSRVFYKPGAEDLSKALHLVESALGNLDKATRWADAYAGLDGLREAVEIMRMLEAKEQQQDERPLPT